MPVKAMRRHHSRSPRHKHTKTYLQTYWPYIPMLIIVLVGLAFGGPRPHKKLTDDVLAYATEVSSGSLLSSTNSQRASNGKASLSLNQQLTSAAQAKANDMSSRNYWSHNTPDGQQPWVFVQNAGYKYSKAGENLAYGFATSSDTVVGWMNSASHKANLLDSAFSEVGFGITNASNFVGVDGDNYSGPETIVVAMYGQPQVAGDSSTSQSKSSTSKKSSSSQSAQAPTEVVSLKENNKAEPVTTNELLATEPTSTAVLRAQTIGSQSLPWLAGSLGLIAGLCAVLLLARHGLGFRRLVRNGEQFAIKHPLIDIMLVTLIMLSYILSSTSGFIK